MSSAMNIAEESPPKRGCWKKFLKCLGKCLKHEGDWLEEMRGTLSLVATVISTITFQVAINPPGGVLQRSADNPIDYDSLRNCSDDESRPICPGEAVSGVVFSDDYYYFLIYNTVSFVASLSVTLLLVSGVPLKNKAVMWVLSIGMCITLTFLGLTYLSGVLMLTPDPVWSSAQQMYTVTIQTWIAMLGLVGVFITLRFVYWLVNKIIKLIKRQYIMPPRSPK